MLYLYIQIDFRVPVLSPLAIGASVKLGTRKQHTLALYTTCLYLWLPRSAFGLLPTTHSALCLVKSVIAASGGAFSALCFGFRAH